jgi:hypothetical protein
MSENEEEDSFKFLVEGDFWGLKGDFRWLKGDFRWLEGEGGKIVLSF